MTKSMIRRTSADDGLDSDSGGVGCVYGRGVEDPDAADRAVERVREAQVGRVVSETREGLK